MSMFGPLDVDAEHRAAVDLFRHVEPRQRLAGMRKSLTLLERDLLRHGQLRRLVDQRAVRERGDRWPCERPARAPWNRCLGDPPALSAAAVTSIARAVAPASRRSFHYAAHAVAAGGHLRAAHSRVAVAPIGGAHSVRDVLPVDVELLGDEHRHRRHDALPHFELGQHDPHRIVRVDPHPDVRLECARRRRGGRAGTFGHVGANHQTAAGGRADFEEVRRSRPEA